jgi:NAD(P)-dependent dehydrogenase (short-subunit alcohol dehydrogenase family)
MATSVTNSVVLVTGSNGGLGTEFVRQALQLGARKVYATARNPRDWGDDRIVALPLDVTDEGSVESAARAASDTTILVNNAGVSYRPDSLLDRSMSEIRGVFETNFFGALAVARAFAPIVAANGGGAFINVHSTLSWVVGEPNKTTGGHQAYAAAKAALWSATNSLRLSLATRGTHVLGLHLGYTATGMTKSMAGVPMNDPADIVGEAYAGLIAGHYEVVADALSARVKLALSGPIEDMYPQLASAANPLGA